MPTKKPRKKPAITQAQVADLLNGLTKRQLRFVAYLVHLADVLLQAGYSDRQVSRALWAVYQEEYAS